MASLKISNDLRNLIKNIVRDIYYPIGKVYLTFGEEDPNTTIGGTWIKTCQGRMLVGFNPNQEEFNTILKIGGNLEHYHLYKIGYKPYYGTLIGGDANIISLYNYDKKIWTNGVMDTSVSDALIKNKVLTNAHVDSSSAKYSIEASTQSTTALPPYIVVYIWKRTA